MRIRADHEVARRDEAFFRQKGVLDAAIVSDLEVVGDSLFLGERAHRGALGGGLDVLVGREVVGDERDLLSVEHRGAAELLELADCDGRGDVVAENEVEPRHDKLAGTEG